MPRQIIPGPVPPPVRSVNGATGDVSLDAADVGAVAQPPAPETGDTLVWSGSEWIAQAPAGGSHIASYRTAAVVSGAVDLSDEGVGVWLVTLIADVTDILLPTALVGEALSIIVIFRQDGVGGRTVTGWPSIAWEGGSAPAVASAAASITSVPLLILGDGTICGVS